MWSHVKNVFIKYRQIGGRSSRAEFWWYFLFCSIIVTPLMFLYFDLRIAHSKLALICSVPFLIITVPYLTVSIRRLHDIGLSGWWLLLLFIPIASIAVLIILINPSQLGENQYGPNPHGQEAPRREKDNHYQKVLVWSHIENVFIKFRQIGGRSSRAEFWWFVLFLHIVLLSAFFFLGYLQYLSPTPSKLTLGIFVILAILQLILYVPFITVSIRRLHDIGQSGKNLLWLIVPLIGALIVIIMWAKPSQPGKNQYGPNPYGQ